MSTGLWTAIIAVLTTVTVIARWSRRRNVPRHKSVAIVVLGDIGRSPRMLYHATSFLRHDFQTTIIAYRGELHTRDWHITPEKDSTLFPTFTGSKPPSALLKSPKCRFVYLPTPLAFASNLPRPLFLLLAPLKVLLGAFNLLWTLIWTTEHCPEYILVQVMPCHRLILALQLTRRLCHRDFRTRRRYLPCRSCSLRLSYDRASSSSTGTTLVTRFSRSGSGQVIRLSGWPNGRPNFML